MPYKLKKSSGGWQVTTPNHPHGFKKTPFKSKKKAMKQMAAIRASTGESCTLIGELLKEAGS